MSRRAIRWLFATVLAGHGVPAGAQSSPSSANQDAANASPYPLNARGFGPRAGQDGFVSRWAEDWIADRDADDTPTLKVTSLGSEAFLTLSAEARLRYNAYDNRSLVLGDDHGQTGFRGVAGADLRLNPSLRFYGEVATGQVWGRRRAAAANSQNDASVQQLFVDASTHVNTNLVGAMIGRQHFADGPRQLLSVSTGPNIQRSWNGVRIYFHNRDFRLGAMDLSVTRLGRGFFDEEVDTGERLTGLNASLIISRGPQTANIYLDPFWIRSRNDEFRSGGRTGLDNRDTYGVRFWGRRGDVTFDWTLAHQSGQSMGREIGAWGLFASQNLLLSSSGWKPRLTSHVDLASGGGAYGTGQLRTFNQLYSSSNYLGDGQFMSLSNLLLIAPGLSLEPTATTSLSIEYGIARRLNEDDAVYGGGMRPYVGSQNVSGYEIGGSFRFNADWSVTERLSFSFSYGRMMAGSVLRRAGFPSGSAANVEATVRY